MYERRSVCELDRDRSRRELLHVVVAAFRREQNQRGPDALASRGDEVRHGFGDDIGVALDEAPQARLDHLEVGRDWTEDALRTRL